MLVLHLETVGRIIIPKEIEMKLRSYRQRRWQVERGGVLAGSLKEDGSWVLSHVMPPSRKNKAGRYWFERNQAVAQEYLDHLFSQSQGQITYLGEWHTHPEPSVKPSKPDIKMLADILQNSMVPAGFVLGIIVDSKKDLLCWSQTICDVHPINPQIFKT